MSTEASKPEPLDFQSLSRADMLVEDPKDDALASLEERYSQLEDRQREERFLWIPGLVITINIFTFQGFQNWGSAVSIVVLEIVFLIVLARRLGVEDVSMLVDRVLASIGSINGDKK